ncbi:MAG: hypothetical protein JSV56_00640 [Methanomassiliicoccales archaeon]|nr:MAG: hypothetical protein JSV56_00640 [Methanomassiliicoccales archaeon]
MNKGNRDYIILIICALYPLFKVRWAKNQVESFCSRIAAGRIVQGLEQRAKDFGLKVKMFKGNDTQRAKIIVWDGWVFARWFCEIEHVNGKVVNKETFFLD